MPNPRLTPEQLEKANELLETIRRQLDELSGGDQVLRFAYNRKIFKELGYDERSKPSIRKRLKAQKLKEQDGICPICLDQLPDKEAELDRITAIKGYTVENTRLVHQECHRKSQADRKFNDDY